MWDHSDAPDAPYAFPALAEATKSLSRSSRSGPGTTYCSSFRGAHARWLQELARSSLVRT